LPVSCVTIEFVVCTPSADKLLPWVYPKVDCRPAFVDTHVLEWIGVKFSSSFTPIYPNTCGLMRIRLHLNNALGGSPPHRLYDLHTCDVSTVILVGGDDLGKSRPFSAFARATLFSYGFTLSPLQKQTLLRPLREIKGKLPCLCSFFLQRTPAASTRTLIQPLLCSHSTSK